MSMSSHFFTSFTHELCAKLCLKSLVESHLVSSWHVLRLFYKDLTGDCSASHNLPESVANERVREILIMEPEYPKTVDLQEVKNKEQIQWNEAKKYVNEDLGVAVDNRRRGKVTHLAKAISIRDLSGSATHSWYSNTK